MINRSSEDRPNRTRRVAKVMATSLALGFGDTPLCHAQSEGVLHARSGTIDVRIDGTLYPSVLPLPTDKATETLNTGPIGPGDSQEVCLESEGQVQCRILQIGVTTVFAVEYAGRVIEIVSTGRGPNARFDQSYRDANTGKIRIDDPPGYELVNIAIALSEYANRNPGLVRQEAPYTQRVREHFTPFASHPFVRAIDEMLTSGSAEYYQVKMNGLTLDMAEDGQIVESSIYDYIGGSNPLDGLQEEIDDFSRQTNFPDFFAANEATFASDTALFENELDVPGMLKWLQRHFPDVEPYQSYRILFSPLVGHSQSGTKLEHEGFTEWQAHVNVPEPPTDAELSPEGRRLWQGAILFTELNHGFIAGPQAAFDGRIAAALRDRSDWVIESETTRSYPGARSVFNEMMNWGLISIYALERTSVSDQEIIFGKVESIMANRGFTRFRSFNRYLVERYRDAPSGSTTASLYPLLVEWAEGVARHGKTDPRLTPDS